MERKETIQLTGMLTISYGMHEQACIQFLPDDPDSEIDGLLLNGSAQLLHCGQFEFVTSQLNVLKSKQQ